MLTAAGVGWPEGGTAVRFLGATGLGWPGERPERVSSQPQQVSRGALLNGHEESPLPGSDRVRQALSAAVSRGTQDAFANDEQVPPRATVPDSRVVVPAVPANTEDTPIGRAAEAAVGVRGSVEREAWPRPQRCRIITIANQKGGVGKTTTAVNLAASLSQHGTRVLVIDLDPQGNASTALDVEHHVGRESVYNALVEERPLPEVITEVAGMPGLFCAPATIDLAGAEIELVPMVARESRLSRALEQLDLSNLDYVLIDCPPSLGLLTVNALVAAEEVLIPIQCEYYALEGLGQLLRNVALVRSSLNASLDVRGITVSNTLSPKWPRTSAATRLARLLRRSNMVSTTPWISSPGLSVRLIRSMVRISALSPSRA